jgi:hypothetical protein
MMQLPSMPQVGFVESSWLGGVRGRHERLYPADGIHNERMMDYLHDLREKQFSQ